MTDFEQMVDQMTPPLSPDQGDKIKREYRRLLLEKLQWQEAYEAERGDKFYYSDRCQELERKLSG